MTSPPGQKTRQRGAVTGSPDHRPSGPVAESDHFQLDERPNFREDQIAKSISPGSGRMCGPPLRWVVSFLVSRTPRKSACAFRAGLGVKSMKAVPGRLI